MNFVTNTKHKVVIILWILSVSSSLACNYFADSIKHSSLQYSGNKFRIFFIKSLDNIINLQSVVNNTTAHDLSLCHCLPCLTFAR